MREVLLVFFLISVLSVPLIHAQDDGGGRPPPGPMGGGDGGERFGPSRRILTHIENVEIMLLESFPVQVHLVVTGEQRDGCNLPVTVRQMRFRNRVWVRIFRVQPEGMMCPTVLMPYQETIPLHGVFEPGTYQIDVNGFEVEFES